MSLRHLIVCSFLCSSAEAATLQWNELVQTSYAYLEPQQERLVLDFDLLHQDHLDMDREKGELVFSSSGVPTVIAEFQLAGSFSTENQTWMWSWANEGVGPETSAQVVHKVRAFGEKHDFVKLTKGYWVGQESDGWEQAAIASYLLQAKGMYSQRLANGVVFFIITDIRKVD